MNFPLVLVLVPLFFFLPGYLFSRLLFRNPDIFSAGERVFLAIATSVLVTAWLALTLAELGIFSLLNLAALIAIPCAALRLFARGRMIAWSFRGLRPDWVFVASLLLAIALFSRPGEYILGNTDAGVYINTGANIARTGSLAIHDAEVARLAPDPAKTFYWQLTNPYMLYTQVRMPGFFIADQAQGLVLPQFLHLYPAWLAVWDALLGVPLGLYATPLIALLASVAFFLLAGLLFGKKIARLAFFLLVVTVPQFWFARYPVAEAMTQFLALTGMYALLKMSETIARSKNDEAGAAAGACACGLPLVAGVAFGQLFLVRSDSILFLVSIGVYALVLILLRKWRREHWALFGAFGVVLAQAVAHMLVFAPNYLYYQYTHAMRMQNIDKLLRIELPSAESLFTRIEYALLVVGLIAVGVGALLVLDRIVQAARRRWGVGIGAFARRSEKWLRVGGAGALVALFVAFYFILPRPESLYAFFGGLTPAGSGSNLIKLGWYLSPFGMLLALLGAVVVVLRDLNTRNLFFIGTAALFSFFYLDELYSNPHYIYTMRHYIPLVIPLFVLCAARGVGWLWSEFPLKNPGWQRLARIAAGGALALWMLYNAYAMGIIDANRAQGVALRLPFVSETGSWGPVRLEPFENSIVGVRELGGAYEQMTRNASQLDPNAVVIFSSGRDEPAALATPLKYVFDRDAFVTVFNNPPGDKMAGMIDSWRAQGREVVLAFGTNGGKLQIPNYDLEPAGEFSLDVPQWAFAYDFMPRSAWRVNLTYALLRAVPRAAPAEYPFVLDFGGDDFPYLVRGFLERAPEARTRSVGAILAENRKLQDVKWIGGVIRVPVPDTTSEGLVVTVRARAPRDGTRFELKHKDRVLGALVLSDEFETYTMPLAPAALESTSEGYLLELAAETTFDNQGRILGAELESFQVTRATPAR
ncbi:MAG: hypothetical protein IT331_18160 [Anaerolineae bacterium]|nr:hypothetical protein [Anaerolineae bacterium]